MTVCLSLLIPTNHLTILSAMAIAGGLYFCLVGFHLLARKRRLLTTPSSRTRSAIMGSVEVNGAATGPYTMSAPISGEPCYLYHASAWQLRDGNHQQWERVADETLHLPFFIEDSTGQLLIEPMGAALDLQHDFLEEYAASSFSSSSAKAYDVPPRVTVFLARHGVIPTRRLRVAEWSIKPEDPVFIAGTLIENPGVQVRPFPPRPDAANNDSARNDSARYGSGRNEGPPNSAPNNFPEPFPVPQIINLSNGTAATTTREMSQQAKIAAALTRAGITKPEVWSVAGVPFQPAPVEENAPPMTSVASDGVGLREAPIHPDPEDSSGFNLSPPVVLMKGAADSTFMISFRSRKEFVSALAWRSAAMICGGAAITFLGVYILLKQIGLP